MRQSSPISGRKAAAFWLLALALLLALIVAVLAVAEVGMRLAGARPVERTGEEPTEFLACDKHPELGWIFPESTEGVFRRGAGGVVERTNEWGLRNPSVGPDSTAVRILVIGDSFAFGWGVRAEEAFPRRLEVLLRERRPGPRIDVINAGIPGYSQFQQRAMLEYILERVRIDAVVSTFSLSNDMVDEIRIRRFAPDRLVEYSPRPRDPESALSRFIEKSRVLTWMDLRTRALQFQAANVLPGSVRKAEASMREIAAMCAEREIPLLLVRLPRRTEIADSGFRGAVGRWMTRGPRSMQDRVAEDLGLPLRDMTGAIRAVHESGNAFLPNDPHWTPPGHVAVADSLIDAVEDLLPR